MGRVMSYIRTMGVRGGSPILEAASAPQGARKLPAASEERVGEGGDDKRGSSAIRNIQILMAKMKFLIQRWSQMAGVF